MARLRTAVVLLVALAISASAWAQANVVVVQRATYTAATTAKTATAAGTAPFFAICGSAAKLVRVQSIWIGGTVGTAAVNVDVQVRKTSAATSGGTPTALVAVPHDSFDPVATVSLLNYYTALATSGTSVGMIGSQQGFFPVTPAALNAVGFDWTNRQESKAPILRGTGQCLEASFGTTTTNAPTLQVQVTWTEE